MVHTTDIISHIHTYLKAYLFSSVLNVTSKYKSTIGSNPIMKPIRITTFELVARPKLMSFEWAIYAIPYKLRIAKQNIYTNPQTQLIAISNFDAIILKL